MRHGRRRQSWVLCSRFSLRAGLGEIRRAGRFGIRNRTLQARARPRQTPTHPHDAGASDAHPKATLPPPRGLAPVEGGARARLEASRARPSRGATPAARSGFHTATAATSTLADGHHRGICTNSPRDDARETTTHLGRSVRIWAGPVLLCTGSAASAEDSRALGFGAPAPPPPSPPKSPSPQLPSPAALGFVGVCEPGFESASPSAASGWFPWKESAPSAVTPWVDTSSGPARVRWREVRRASYRARQGLG